MSQSPKTVLVVDDEPALVEVIADNLMQGGFHVLTAADGAQALERALAIHPDLILLDIVMPKMDGVTMLKKLREDAWGKNVPVIMLTNLTDAAKVSGAIEQGAFGYLIKTDWKIEDIVTRVKGEIGE